MAKKMLSDVMVNHTLDYDKFRMIGGNRSVNKANLKKLKESMKEEQLIIPIIINEKFEIIDGQHRFFAARDLRLPIYYIMNYGYGLDQVKRANTVGINWVMEDFLKTYMIEGIEDYIILNNLVEASGIGLKTMLKIFGEFQDLAYDSEVEQFKNGTFKVDLNGELAGIRYFCDSLEMFSAYRDYKASAFVEAFLKLYVHDDYLPEVMEKQARWISNLQLKANSKNVILEEFCKQVYSYRQSDPNKKIYFNKDLNRFFK